MAPLPTLSFALGPQLRCVGLKGKEGKSGGLFLLLQLHDIKAYLGSLPSFPSTMAPLIVSSGSAHGQTAANLGD